MDWIARASPRHLARTAGCLYFINIVLGFFAIGYVPAALQAAGDAAATARNILDNVLLYRFGLVAHMTILATNIPLTVIWYELFKVVNRRVVLLVVFFSLVGTAIEAANLLSEFLPLVLLERSLYSSAFTVEQVQALAYIAFDMHANNYSIYIMFFGFFGLTLGYLVFRSTFVPRVMGVLMAFGGLAYLFSSFANFLAPAFAASLFPLIALPSFLGEGSLCLWFLVIGVNVHRWQEQAAKTV
jgi:hypothetical protein